MHHDAYAEIVELYDLEHAEFTDDVEFLIELADLGDGAILELGCGTGRVLLPLAAAGHEMIGVDLSKPMLDVCATRAAQSGLDITLHRGDMADLHLVPGAPFGMIVASLNSVMHLTSAAQRGLLAAAFSVLETDGRLVIDTLNPSHVQLSHLLNATHLEGTWQTENGSTVDKWGHRKPGVEPQVIDTLLWYDRVEADGSLQRVRTQFNLRYIHKSELALLLELAGFGRVDWYGNYELEPWDAESERIIVVAHKDNA
jgi:SAM-dependent methyltransferase